MKVLHRSIGPDGIGEMKLLPEVREEKPATFPRGLADYVG